MTPTPTTSAAENVPDIRMSTQDALWLTMDRPNNLMIIDGLMWTHRRIPPDDFRALLAERVVERFPVFSSIPAKTDAGWVWRQFPEFDLDEHLRVIELPGDAGFAELRELISVERSRPLEHDRPLWSAILVDNLHAEDGPDGRRRRNRGSAVIMRSHHSLADGIRLTQVILGLCDTMADSAPTTVGKNMKRPDSMEELALEAVKALSSDALDAARSTAELAIEEVRLGTDPRAGVPVLGSMLRATSGAVGLVRNPTRLADVAQSFGSATNRSVNDVAAVTKLLMAPPSTRTVWSGEPGVAKSADWAPTLPLAEVKAIGRATGSTVNDVLIGAVAGALTRYLRHHGDHDTDELMWMVPVSVRPFEEQPTSLGNHFALVAVRLPIGEDNVAERLRKLHAEMDRIKASDEAALTYTVQRAISQAPTPLAVGLTNFFADKAVGVLTNVPGPRSPLGIAGREVAGVLAWAPCSGKQVMTICIFSYNGKVSVGFGGDAALVPDIHLLPKFLTEEFEKMREVLIPES